VLRRLRRPAAALCVVLLVPALAACGDDSDDKADDPKSSTSASADGSEGELKEVSFSGEVGESITAEWKSEVKAADEVAVTTLVKGEGDAVTEGDTVSTYLWAGNGTTQEDVFSDYDNGAPESIPYSADQLDPVFTALFDGQTYGSRVVAVASATEVFGESVEDNSLGVGATDTLVIVADIVEKQEESPEPSSDKPEDAKPDTQPSVVEKDGKPTGLDFSGIEEPELDAPVQRVILKEGDGAALKASDTVTVHYLGSTYDAEAPFDESYSTGQPLEQPLSGLIQGWTIGLEGVKVGSRVLLQIPPAYGYGAQGSGEAIPGNSTLWFVIDIVKAK
jgi:peptidylprolyl isomerase